MRAVQQIVARFRARVRSATSVLPASSRSRPARIAVRVNDRGGPPGLPGADGAELSESVFRERLVEAVDWLGPARIRFVGGTPTLHPRIASMVRFAQRLDSPVGLVTSGAGLDEPLARQLVDAGIDEVLLWVASTDPEVQRDRAGGTIEEAEAAARSLVEACEDRGVTVRIGVWVPEDEVPEDVAAWSRRLGLASCVAVGRWADASGRPGSPRTGACVVASRRLEIRPDGSLGACPFHAPLAGEAAGDVEARWRAGASHFDAIRACDRSCAHTEIVGRR